MRPGRSEMGIENAKLVACPIKTIPKERVLEEIKKVLEPVIKIVASAVSRGMDFDIPVIVSGAEEGECLISRLLDDAGPYDRVAAPSEEEVEATVNAEISHHLCDSVDRVEFVVYYDFDGDFFDLVVAFESICSDDLLTRAMVRLGAQPEPVGPIDREKMQEKLHTMLIEKGLI
jgi:hypothetical protein